MIINTAEEGCCSILPDEFDQQMWATGMFINKCSDVVNKAGNENERSLLSLLLDWPIGTVRKGKMGRMEEDVQLSQLITGKSSLSLGQTSFSCVSLSFFNSIVNWPFRTSLSGKT